MCNGIRRHHSEIGCSNTKNILKDLQRRVICCKATTIEIEMKEAPTATTRTELSRRPPAVAAKQRRKQS